MTYYLTNLQFLFNNIPPNNDIELQICVNFFVSNIDTFIVSLKYNKFIEIKEYTKNIYKIYENETNYVETEYIELNLLNYDFKIIVHEIISIPNKNVSLIIIKITLFNVLVMVQWI